MPKNKPPIGGIDFEPLADCLLDNDKSNEDKIASIREYYTNIFGLSQGIDAVVAATGEKGWSRLEFTPYTPDDTHSTLRRKWRAQLTGQRSDGLFIVVEVVSEQSDTPLRMGMDLMNAFDRLETYRNCDCTSQKHCDIHKVKVDAPTV